MTSTEATTKNFLFSVVIPIYNCGEYLPDAMESLVNQTIGFNDNIQVILVNDGSTDNSKDVCLQYCSKYPDNVSYYEQPNSGVSAARNLGMKHIQGEYVNFLDADDKWQNDVFVKAERMFRKHPEIDVIGVRQHNFEASNDYPALDYKFDKDKIVDIFNSYDHIQLSVTSAFFRFESLKDTQFDTNIKYSEDSKFIFEILCKKENLGIISSSEHLYRKRATGSSAIQGKSTNIEWYTTTPELCYKWAINKSIKKYGYVIPYVQYYIMYDYQWRCKEHIPSAVYNTIIDKYLKITKELISYIDDNIILEQKNMYAEYKFEFLKLKYGDNAYNNLTYRHHRLYYNNLYLSNIRHKGAICLNSLSIDNDQINISGTFNTYLPQSAYKLYAVINKIKFPVCFVETDVNTRYFFNRPFISNLGFQITTNRKTFKSLSFKLIYDNYYQSNMPFSSGPQFNLEMDTGLFYTKLGRIYFCKGRKITCAKRTRRNQLAAYCRCDKWLRSEKRNDIRRLRLSIIIHRHLLQLTNREIWLFSDRANAANDNGAALFEYVCKHRSKNIIPIFIISKESPDYKKMKAIGKVSDYGTKRHKKLFLLATKNISSQADDWVTNPYGVDIKWVRDIVRSDFIFLQHGIIMNDLSSWLSMFSKNIVKFCCASKPEYQSITSNAKYSFGKDIVKLTGLARYDKLKSNPKREIIIAPTWRRSLASPIDLSSGVRAYSNKFKSSYFFQFYNSLINDPHILSTLKKNNFRIKFLLHHTLTANAKDFAYDKSIVELITNADYSKYFSRGDLLVTDYSSVAFDFAYLYKPVIYTQFDKEDFFAGQIYNQGYYSYEKDGFGPVCYNYESTVKAICQQIENGCKMSKKYRGRVNKTFAYHDNNNCKRILEMILSNKENR